MKTKLLILALTSMLVLAGCTVPALPPVPAANAPAARPAVTETAAAPATSAPAAPPAATPAAPLAKTGLGDKYYPLEGNPGYDAQHYTIDLSVKVDANYITGTTTLAALATSDLADFNLDFLGLDVSAVSVDGAPAAYSRDGQELSVTPAAPIAAGTPFSVSVTYGGVPAPYPDPALAVAPATTGWKVWDKGVIAAVAQPDGAMTWFPSNNHPTDKATYTFRITVDDPNVAVANGILKEVIPAGDHAHTYVWEMAQPMATEVSLVAIGDYEEFKSVAPTGVPIRNYFLKGTDPAVIQAFDVTGEMMAYITDLLGPYPFDAYGAIVVPGFIPDSALETQSLSVFDDSEHLADMKLTMMHELVHQWIGNTETVADWSDLWLHEGFARYFEALWVEKTEGVDAYNAFMQHEYKTQQVYGSMAAKLGRPDLKPGEVIPPVDPGVGLLFLPTYQGGSLALHALRLEVGDKVFFDIVRTFYQEHKEVPATTKEFIATAEKIAGRDLSSVWNVWLYGTTLPAELPLLPAAAAK